MVIKPEFDIDESGHPGAPVTCPTDGHVWARLTYIVVRNDYRNALECETCSNIIAFETSNGWEDAQ